jgi:putative hemolysin
MLLYILLIVVFLVFSAFFSGMEAALFSLSRFRIKTLLFEERTGARTVERLKRESGRTLATILLANLIANIGCSSVAALLLVQLIERFSYNQTIAFIVQFILMTSLILLVGEITPKTIAVANAEFLSLRFGGIIRFIAVLFNPISKLMVMITRRISTRGEGAYDAITDKEIRYMLREAKKFKVLDEGEEKFAYRILQFRKVRIEQIMTPRHDVIGINSEATLSEARSVIVDNKHSRICVFDKKGDVLGLIYAKDLFVHCVNNPQAGLSSVKSIMREPYVVHETKRAETLLAEFRKNGIHCGVVVDEYGYFTGLVTLEDILESIFGEILDEFDEYGELTDVPYKKVDESVYLFNGDIRIGEISMILEIDPFDDEGERLAGFIFKHLKRLPREGDTIKLPGLSITIREIRDRTIEEVMVKKVKA